MKALKLAFVATAIVFLVGGPAFAYKFTRTETKGGKEVQVEYAGPDSATFSGALFGAGIVAGLVIAGAGFGFGKIGGSALEAMARQPEAAAKIQPAMIIIAALLEGATFFALIVCIQVAGLGNW